MPKKAASASSKGHGHDSGVPVVDLHCHVQVPSVEALVRDHPELISRRKNDAMLVGSASSEVNRNMIKAIAPKLTALDKRLEDMDRMGIDIQAVSPSPAQYHYWAEEDLAEEIVKLQNERMVEIQETTPRRFVSLGTVSLQHPKLACEQLVYLANNLGLRGVQISTEIEGMDLSDPVLTPFWQKAEELDILVSIHPFGCDLGGERLAQHYLQNIIGQPLETTIALSRLIFSGLLDDFPALKLLSVHGGGYLPSYIGRSDHAYEMREECQHLKNPPSWYLRKFYFDSLVYNDTGLKCLCKQVGVERVVLGSDYPYDMGCSDPVGHVQRQSFLSDGEKKTILGGTACHLLKINEWN